MKLQTKIMMVMIATWFIICTMVIIDSKFIVAQNYRELEQHLIQHRMYDTQHTFDRMLASLSLYTLAWSQWDDAYNFLKIKNDKFIKSNFVAAIYKSSKLNFIMFFNTKGQLYYGQSYDEATDKMEPVSPILLDYLHENKFFVTHPTVASSKVGILQTQIGLIIMSSRPVIMSSGKVPVLGSILMGYYLDNSFFEDLSQTIIMKVRFFPMAAVLADNQLHAAYLKLTSDKNYSVTFVNPKLAYGFILLKDINAKPVGLMQIAIPRLIYQEGLWTAYHYIAIILISGMIIILLMWYLLKVLVLNRVMSIRDQVLKINTERQFDHKISVSSHDELSNMVFTINNMLGMVANSQDQLRYLASHDVLTQLPNREYFYELLSQALIKAKKNKSKVAVMFIDIDKLKNINDHYGHAIGDTLIKIVANRIRKSIRKSDVVGHQSGDEFILFMQNIADLNIVTNTAKRILQSTSQPITIGDINITVTCSIGISIYPNDSTKIEELIKYADDVMYLAKTQSGNSYRYYNENITLKI